MNEFINKYELSFARKWIEDEKIEMSVLPLLSMEILPTSMPFGFVCVPFADYFG
jgi:hypothetical protein